MRKKLITSLLMLSIVCSCNVNVVSINAAGMGSVSKDELIKQKQESDKKAKELEQQKNQHKQQLDGSNNQMAKVSDSIKNTNDKISKVQKDINDTQKKIRKS
jgi:peptidoglycan hydrolase CwlO-like protein